MMAVTFFDTRSQINIEKPRPHYVYAQKCTVFSPFARKNMRGRRFATRKKIGKKLVVSVFYPQKEWR